MSQDVLPELRELSLEDGRVVSTWEDPNPQRTCPFFNGRIPGEIRNKIFDFVFTESLISPLNLDVRQGHQLDDGKDDIIILSKRDRLPGNKIWPGYSSPKTIVRNNQGHLTALFVHICHFST
jgi:hypothetical protein